MTDSSHPISQKMRLAKALAQCGVASRRQAEVLILEGRVKVNNITAQEVTTFVTIEKDIITVNGKPISLPEKLQVWAYYKPVGIITTHKDPEGRLTVFEDVQAKGLPHVVSVGRLDINSEGLLLLTNQGSFAHFAEAPKTGWKRCYRVRVFADQLPIKDLMELQQGITIDGFHYDSIEVDIPDYVNSRTKNSWLMVTLKEGKNREIRKVMNHLGLSVNRLIRVSYGPFCLEDMRPGEIREVPQRMLKNYIK